MRWLLSRLLSVCKTAFVPSAVAWLTVLCCSVGPANGQTTDGPTLPPSFVLDDRNDSWRDTLAGWQWTDPDGSVTLAQLLATRRTFTPIRSDQIHALGATGALWFQLRLQRPAASQAAWVAEIELPSLDFVTLYQQDRAGIWSAQIAGDKLAVASWPMPGRYPVFRLNVPSGEARDIYLKVQHNARSSIPLRIAPSADYLQRSQLAYLGLGLVFGGLGLLIVACLVQSVVYRDRAFFGYSAYASTMALAMAAFTGVGSHLLWPHSGVLGDASQGALALLSAATAILFVRDLSGIALPAPRLAAMARAIAFAVPLLILVFVVVARPSGAILLGAYLAFACGLNILIAWRSWRAGDRASLWILAAYVPLAVAIALTLMRVFGLAPASWGNQYGMVAAMGVQVPLLLLALGIHSRERHGATIRELALSSQDALTGLLAPHLFHDRLRQCVARHRQDGESAAVLVIDLVNHPRIKEQYGSVVAEQSLLRSVIKLRRFVREIDTLSRIGEARFGLIQEQTRSRVTVTDRAARVIASGLMPIKGQNPEVRLQFHVAAALLNEVRLEPAELTPALGDLLATMRPNTSRPIRFLGGAAPDPAPAVDSGLSPLSPGPAPA